MFDQVKEAKLAGLLIVLLATAAACSTSGESASPPAAETEPPEGTAVAPTQVGTVTVSGSECTLDLPGGSISAGPVTLTAVNENDAPAAFDMFMIADGHSYRELAARIEKERQLAEAGKAGIGPGPSVFVSTRITSGLLEARESGTLTGAVEPGRWAIVCLQRFKRTADPVRPFFLVGPVEVE